LKLTNENKQIYLTKLQPASSLKLEESTRTLAVYYPNKLFVGSLSRTTTPSQLASYFRRFGAVIQAKIVVDASNNSKGYGFVTFERTDVVEEILEGSPLYLNGKRIAVASAIRKKHDDEDE